MFLSTAQGILHDSACVISVILIYYFHQVREVQYRSGVASINT